MDKMIEIRDMLCDELEKFAEHGEVNASAVEMIDKLSHSIKSIDTILAMKGYSEDDMSYERGGSRRSGRSYRNGRSYERGNSRREGRSYRGYSMAEHKDRIIEQLEDMMEDADAGTKAAIKKAIHSLEE